MGIGNFCCCSRETGGGEGKNFGFECGCLVLLRGGEGGEKGRKEEGNWKRKKRKRRKEKKKKKKKGRGKGKEKGKREGEKRGSDKNLVWDEVELLVLLKS